MNRQIQVLFLALFLAGCAGGRSATKNGVTYEEGDNHHWTPTRDSAPETARK